MGKRMMADNPGILIVDDDKVTCRLIEKKLSEFGMATQCAHTGKETIELCRQILPRLMLLDYRLQDITGQEVIETLAQEDINPPFIIITGHGDEKVAVKMMKLGALDYIVKDMNFIEMLPSTVQRALERLDINEKLKRSQEERSILMMAIDQTDEAIIITDADAAIEYVNPAFIDITGYEKEELIGKNPSILQSGKTDEKVYKDLWEKIASGKKWQGRFVNRKKDGTEYLEEGTISPMLDERGKITNYIGVKRDITEHESMTRQIQHTQKIESLGILTGGIAHDFNNMLAGILGNAGLARMKQAPGSPAIEHIQNIELAAQRASELTNQLLAYTGKGKFVTQTVNINTLIEEMGYLLNTVISSNAIIRYNFTEDIPNIEGDLSQIRQVIMNLITNASDAISKRSGFINITTGSMYCDAAYLKSTYFMAELKEGDYVFIEVSDTGSGMDEDVLAKIFDPFFTTKPEGRGLGLAALLGIVRGHKGIVKVYSEPNRGTTFKVLFPVSTRPVKSEIPDSNGEEEWKAKGTTLVADDDEDVLDVMQDILKQLGFEVLTARDGKEAVEAYNENHENIDLVILDMTMPRLDGSQVLGELKKTNAAVKVILTSGFTEEDITGRFAGRGLVGFIQKPFSVKDFIQKIKAVME